MANVTNDALEDPIVLAIIQDRVLLEEEYKKTEKLIEKIREKLTDDTLTPEQTDKLDIEINKIKSQFDSFVATINEHTKWLEQQLKDTHN